MPTADTEREGAEHDFQAAVEQMYYLDEGRGTEDTEKTKEWIDEARAKLVNLGVGEEQIDQLFNEAEKRGRDKSKHERESSSPDDR